jgi:hypothetical protein
MIAPVSRDAFLAFSMRDIGNVFRALRASACPIILSGESL